MKKIIFYGDGREFRFVYSAMAHEATHEKFLPAFRALIKSVRLTK